MLRVRVSKTTFDCPHEEIHVGASRRKAIHGRQRVGRGCAKERINVAPVLVGSMGHHDPPAVPDGLAVGNSAVTSDFVARVHD